MIERALIYWESMNFGPAFLILVLLISLYVAAAISIPFLVAAIFELFGVHVFVA